MENNEKKDSYLRTDDNKIINEKYIRWVLKMNECLEVCTKSNGCTYDGNNTHTICKSKSFESYSKLNELFK
jgi:hypothetical protein